MAKRQSRRYHKPKRGVNRKIARLQPYYEYNKNEALKMRNVYSNISNIQAESKRRQEIEAAETFKKWVGREGELYKRVVKQSTLQDTPLSDKNIIDVAEGRLKQGTMGKQFKIRKSIPESPPLTTPPPPPRARSVSPSPIFQTRPATFGLRASPQIKQDTSRFTRQFVDSTFTSPNRSATPPRSASPPQQTSSSVRRRISQFSNRLTGRADQVVSLDLRRENVQSNRVRQSNIPAPRNQGTEKRRKSKGGSQFGGGSYLQSFNQRINP
eukprot:SAG11_NODE_3020_length_2758_cov_379.460323_2_plen_268_part_00